MCVIVPADCINEMRRIIHISLLIRKWHKKLSPTVFGDNKPFFFFLAGIWRGFDSRARNSMLPYRICCAVTYRSHHCQMTGRPFVEVK